jgi:hypothetical protein
MPYKSFLLSWTLPEVYILYLSNIYLSATNSSLFIWSFFFQSYFIKCELNARIQNFICGRVSILEVFPCFHYIYTLKSVYGCVVQYNS